MRKIAALSAAFFACALAGTCVQAAPLPPGRTPAPCRDDAKGRALDFWVGAWTVTNADGTKAGTNTITRLLNGCAITEEWRGLTPDDVGMSLFTYDARARRWEQTWVTPDTTRPGSLKHKTMTAMLYANAVRFEGTIRAPGGKSIIDRTTLTPWRDGRVRQTIEWSRDGGKSWETRFDAYYNRVGKPDLGARHGGDPH